MPGMYTITVTGVDDATGTLTSSTTITIIIPAATGQTACVTCSIITQLQPISTFGTPSITQAFTIPSITQAFTTPSIIQAQVSPQTQPGTGDFFVNNAFLMIGAVAVAILLISGFSECTPFQQRIVIVTEDSTTEDILRKLTAAQFHEPLSLISRDSSDMSFRRG